MKKIIINADDFGMSSSVNRGIVEAMTKGIVSSTTIMMNMPKAQEAIEMAKQHNITSIGIHLNLTKGYPLLSKEEIPLLVLDSGKVKDIRKEVITPEIKKQIKKEFIAQIDSFYAHGLQPTHLDSHHHIHMLEGINEVVKELAIQYNLPTRSFNFNSSENTETPPTPDFLDCAFYGSRVSTENLLNLLTKDNKGIVEIMTHPGYVDQELYEISIYNDMRKVELDILSSPEVLEFVRKNNIRIVSFKEAFS